MQFKPLFTQQKCKPNARFGKLSGLSLVELMLAMGIGATVIAGTMLFFSNADKSREVMELMAARDSVASKLAQTAGLPAAIAVAMGSDAALRNCVMGNGTVTACSAARTDPAQQRHFVLSIPTGTVGNSRVAGQASAAATTDNQTWYDLKGRPSTNSDSNCRVGASVVPSRLCPFQALTYWYAACPGGTGTCPFGAFINVRYQVRIWQAPAGTAAKDLPGGGFAFAHSPPEPEFTTDPTSYAIPVSADQIRRYSNSACSAFHPLAIASQGASGTTTSNSLRCVCPTGYTRVPANIDAELTNCIATVEPSCGEAAGKKCIMVGMRRNNMPVCRTLAERRTCKNIDLSNNENCVVNGQPGWLEKITVGTCKVKQPPAGSKKAAAGQIEIDCDTSIGKCCNFTTNITAGNWNATECN